MFKNPYRLCKIFGIPIQLDFSLLILLFLLISSYGSPVYGLAAGLALLVSITLHELGHSLTAIAFGCRVRDITLMMLGGQATMLSMPRKAWQEFLMAAAGPAVSLALALAGLLLPNAHFSDGSLIFKSQFDKFIFMQVGALNFVLFCFNLLPAFPMDGGRILRAFLQQFFMTRLRATWVASRIGRFLAICMALSVLYSILARQFEEFMLVRLLIAFYIFRSAEQEYRMVVQEEQPESANPFSGFPFFGGHRTPPPGDDQAVVSPPPYARRDSGTRVDVHKE